MKTTILISISLLIAFNIIASNNYSLLDGCTDPTASNYNPSATVDDGSCEYLPEENPCQNIGFIPNAIDGTVSIIDLNSGLELDLLTGFDNPIGIHAASAADRVFIPNFNTDLLTVIEASTYTVLDQIPVQNDPWGVTSSPDGEIVIVTGGTVPGDETALHDLNIIDLSDNSTSVAQTIGQTSGVVISPDLSTAYATCFWTDQVAIIDIPSATVLSYIQTGTDSHPNGIDISADGTLLYVALYSGSKMTIFDLSDSNSATDVPLGLAPSYPEGIEISPDESTVAIALQGTHQVAFYDITTGNTTLFDFDSGDAPNGVSYSGDGTHLAVTMQEDDELWYIDVPNQTAEIIPTGDKPKCFGHFIISLCKGCTYLSAENYNPAATEDDGSCTFLEPCGSSPGCMYSIASNYDSTADIDDGSCEFPFTCAPDFNYDCIVNAADLLYFLGQFGSICPDCE